MLRSIISASQVAGTSNLARLAFDVLTDTGYSYQQTFGQGSDRVMMWLGQFLDYEAACWWFLHSPEHQHVTVPRKTVPEDLEVILRSKPGSSMAPFTVTVSLLTYDAGMQELRKIEFGGYQLVSLTRTE